MQLELINETNPTEVPTFEKGRFELYRATLEVSTRDVITGD